MAESFIRLLTFRLRSLAATLLLRTIAAAAARFPASAAAALADKLLEALKVGGAASLS